MPLPRIVRASLVLGLASALAFAQATLPTEAAAALAEGEAAMAQALVSYPAPYPDRPLWQQAFAAGRRAGTLAPTSLEPVRFLAEAYSRANWPGPAWNTWQSFIDRGGVLDAEARALFASVGKELAYGAYARGDLEGALALYLEVTDRVAEDVEARVWVGRILQETNRPAQAVPFWRSVLELDPGDARAAYFLELAQERTAWGTRAVEVFREGVAMYEQREFSAAAERFSRATVLNPAYPAAWAWLGRVAFEVGNYRDARDAYANASGLQPENETYRYFLAQAIALVDANE